MKPTKNTYSLLVGSEEKGRSIFEGAVYALVVLSAAFSAWQFASSGVTAPVAPASNNAPAPMVAKAAPQPPLVAVADRG